MNTVWRNVTPTFIYKALRQEALPVENGGVATRDFIYVEDIVGGLLACATRGEAGRGLQPGQRRPRPRSWSWRSSSTSSPENPTPIALAPHGTGTTRASASGAPRRRAPSSDSSAQVELREGLRAHDRLDARQSRAGSSGPSRSTESEWTSSPRFPRTRRRGKWRPPQPRPRVIEPGARRSVPQPAARSGGTGTSSTTWPAGRSRAATSSPRSGCSGRSSSRCCSRRVQRLPGSYGRRFPPCRACPIRCSRSPGWCSGCSSPAPLSAASGSTVANEALISKVYFPRVIIPLHLPVPAAGRLRLRLPGRDRRHADLRRRLPHPDPARARDPPGRVRCGLRGGALALGAERQVPRRPPGRPVPDPGRAFSSARSSIRSTSSREGAAAPLRAQPGDRTARGVPLGTLRDRRTGLRSW